MTIDPHEAEDLRIHVAICGERWRGMEARLRRLEVALWLLLVFFFADRLGAPSAFTSALSRLIAHSADI